MHFDDPQRYAAVKSDDRAAPPPRTASLSAHRPVLIGAGCIAFAVALNLFVQGYQFGHSNHTVYLLDAMRHVEPNLLKNDWFATQTFQYHALFGRMTRGLMAAGIAKPAFLVGYVALIILLHTAWWRLVRALGGGAPEFLLSEVIYQLLGAGVGLGMYMIIQDSCFLPSNISAVALLFALALWLERQPVGCGIALGVAGAFHLNYAPVALLLWVLLQAWELRKHGRALGSGGRFWLATAAALVPAGINIFFALRITAGRSGAMPLADFVDIYVRLRHPHHYDPSTWPTWLWIAVILPTLPAIGWWIWRQRSGRAGESVNDAARIFLFFTLLIVASLVAGAMYFSESLVQASLMRFSVFPKLLGCIGTAFLICEVTTMRGGRPALIVGSIATAVLLMVLCVIHGPYAGLYRPTMEDGEYQAACDWIRANTPVDAVFLVPPSEESFRLRAGRAIVVNFKGVPQLSAELIDWRKRVETVLDISDLKMLPRPYSRTVESIRERFGSLPPDRLAEIAAKYDARYILTATRFDQSWEPRRLEMNGNDQWFLYDLRHGSEGH